MEKTFLKALIFSLLACAYPTHAMDDSDKEKYYKDALNSVWIKLTGKFATGSEPLVDMCSSSIKGYRGMSIGEDELSEKKQSCLDETTSRLHKYVNDAVAEEVELENCRQMTMLMEPEFWGAPINMRFSPFAKSTNPARFYGKLEAEESRLYVRSSKHGDAFIVVNDDSIVFEPDQLAFDTLVQGYAVPTGESIQVSLVNGAKEVWPVLTVKCIESAERKLKLK